MSQVGRIASTPEAIRDFAAGLGSEDQVVLDASGSVMAIARILRESNVGRVWSLMRRRRVRSLTRG